MEFEERIASVKKPPQSLLQSLEKEYIEIGEAYGYVPVQSPLFLCLKKKGSQAGIEVQFGGRGEVEKSLKRLASSGSDLCFIITSSKAHSLPIAKIRQMLFQKFETKSQKYIFLDLETRRKLIANAEWEKFSSKINRPDWAKPGPMPLQPIFRQKRGGEGNKP